MIRASLRLLLRLLPLALLLAAMPATARTLRLEAARVVTAVATLEQVDVRLDWPADAGRGDLVLRARRVVAPDLGYRFRDVQWRCPLRRDGRGGWRCDGAVSGGGRPMRLDVALGAATTGAVLAEGRARMSLHRTAAAPEFTTLELARVPVAWAQALAAQAWPEARLKAGALSGRLRIRTPKRAPLHVQGGLRVDGLGLETVDGTIAADRLGGAFDIDYRQSPDRSALVLDGQLQGGEFLAGNAYVALPATPVALRVEADRSGDRWRLPAFRWDDGGALQASGSAAFGSEGGMAGLDVQVASRDVAPLAERYLSGWLGLAGLAGLEMRGGATGTVRLDGNGLQAASIELRDVDVRDPQGRFRFDGLSGAPRFSATSPAVGTLRWRGGELYGLAFGPAALPLESRAGEIRMGGRVAIPMLGGQIGMEGFRLRPASAGTSTLLEFGLQLERLDIGRLAEALGWPAFRGTLSGRIPRARYAGDRLEFDGGLSAALFGGRVDVSSLAMERPFGVAPTLSADIEFDDLDLLALTGVFDFGSITGRLDGHVRDLRLVDWTATTFDAELRTDRKRGVRQRISQRAVQSISEVGGGSGYGVAGLQGRLISLFDDFGYSRIGLRCRLANEVCEMGGLHSAGNAFTILEGSGIPRLTVIGHNRRVDWPTLLERLAAVGKGEIKPVVD